MKASTRIISLVLLGLFVSACASAPRFHVEPIPGYDVCFERDEGWTGGDGAYSVALPGGRVLWLFGDTWIGPVRDNRHVDAVIIHNTAAIQPGTEPVCLELEFFYPHLPDGRPGPLVHPQDGRGWLWLLDGVSSSGGLYVFMLQVEVTDPASTFGFRAIGSWLGRVDNPEAAPDAWRISQERIPFSRFSERGDRVFGSAVLEENGFVYIYGTEERSVNGKRRKSMLLARAPGGSVSNFEQWRFFSGKGWVPDPARAEAVAEGVASEFSVSFVASLDRYALIYTENGFSQDFLLRLAPRPWGPWSDPLVLYRCPEMNGRPEVFCYAAKAHPELSGKANELIVTYIASATDFQALIEDATLYRPRFLRVTFGK